MYWRVYSRLSDLALKKSVFCTRRLTNRFVKDFFYQSVGPQNQSDIIIIDFIWSKLKTEPNILDLSLW